MQPVAQRRWGELALVPVGYRGEEGEGVREEPRQVHLWRLLCRYINTDVQVRYPVRRRGYHVDGRGWGEALASQDSGVEVVYTISTMASFVILSEGPHRRPRVWHQPKYSWLLRQPADVREEDHGLPLLGGAHPRGHVGPVGLGPALGDFCHCHACLRGSGIHCGHGAAESRQRRQVMEPNASLDLGG